MDDTNVRMRDHGQRKKLERNMNSITEMVAFYDLRK